ncbi:MAG: UDP-3-O-acyl-N-acetylglucosamine deacetylase, partial [Bacteroidota bacterium]
MGAKQHTLAKTVSLSGVGLHTGVSASITFHPADENHGIAFKRTDLPDSQPIPALVENVIDTSRSTKIGKDGASVQTIEHVMATLYSLGIDNALLEVSGPEVPIMDGSARDFLNVLLEAGSKEQEAEREVFVIDEPVHYIEKDRRVELAALPAEDFNAAVMIDFDSDVLNPQHASIHNLEDFSEQIADSRTFCF